MCIQIIRRFTTAQRYTKMPHYNIGAALKNLKGAMFFVGPWMHGCANITMDLAVTTQKAKFVTR